MAARVEWTMSDKGFATLRHHEGDVLKAYLCPANHWTISMGLTKHSGVIDPRPGMVITREESERLTRLALARNYEPRVRQHFDPALVPHSQAAFDAAVSFDFNTGRIHNATWVRRWMEGAFAAARASLMQWVRGGGRVLPGLERRRKDEAAMAFDGRYPAIPGGTGTPRTYAVFVIDVEPEKKRIIREVLADLGYDVGAHADQILIGAVKQFQADHDLTVDGLIGRATLATLQREIDARKFTKAGAGATGGGAATTGGAAAAPEAIAETGASPELVAGGGIVLTLLGIAALAIIAWRYRDILAVPIQNRMPRVAAWLRSF